MLEVVMAILRAVLVPMFIVGMIGSTVVVAITFAHDVVDFATEDDPVPSSEPRS